MSLNFALRFLNYYFSSQTKHDIHSPFVYMLVTKVIYPDKIKPEFRNIESRRKLLSRSNLKINSEDFGAGHQGKITSEHSLGFIVRNAAKRARYCRLLYRITQHFKPACMIELGTSAGFSAMYLATGNLQGELTTIEGNRSLNEVDIENFKTLGLKNINAIVGSFEKELPLLLKNSKQVDFIYIDGNHKKEPTLSFFEQCLGKSHKNTIFVFDDINWSEEMQEAWNMIKDHHKVTVTIDLFMMGLVFINPDFSKENFSVRY